MLFVLALLALSPDWGRLGLSDPVRLRAGGTYVDVEHGHANPLFADIDNDSRLDLLVGQFERGELRIYHNSGTKSVPKLDAPAWFQAGGTTGQVPFG